jgi:hypothetical protein
MRKPMFKTFAISIASVVFAGMLMSPAKADPSTPYDSLAFEHRQIQITPGDSERPQDIGRAQPRRDFIAEFDAVASQTSHLEFHGGEERDSSNCHTWEFNPCIDWVKSIGGYALAGQIMLPVCQTESSSACVEGLELANGTGRSVASFSRHISNQISDEKIAELNNDFFLKKIHDSTWAASPRLGMPAASTPSLWSAPGFNNLGGTDTYMVKVWMNVSVVDRNKVNVERIQARVTPYVEVQDSRFEPPVWISYLDGSKTRTRPTNKSVGPDFTGNPWAETVDFKNAGNKDGQLCAWVEIDKCGVATRFSDGTSAQLKIRIPKEIGGWFFGRLGSPELSINPISKKMNLLTVKANAVEVPITSVKWPMFDGDFQAYTERWKKEHNPDTTKQLLDMFKKTDDARLGGGDWGTWYPASGIGRFKDYEGLMGDRSIGSTQIWSFSSLPDVIGNPCFADKTRVQGILTTNSMVYQPGLPTFTKGQLSYQVAGLHYNHDGRLFTGDYTLQMRADDARCLYGYTEAPIQTKVSVTDSGGTQKIATTSVSERGGWLTIRARNFTFSSPKIVISIKQGKKSKAASTASVSVGKGKSLAAKTLMSKAKIKAKKGDKLDISVVGTTTSGVTDSGKSLKFKSKGTYNAKVTVVRKNGTSTSRVFKVVVK